MIYRNVSTFVSYQLLYLCNQVTYFETKLCVIIALCTDSGADLMARCCSPQHHLTDSESKIWRYHREAADPVEVIEVKCVTSMTFDGRQRHLLLAIASAVSLLIFVNN